MKMYTDSAVPGSSATFDIINKYGRTKLAIKKPSQDALNIYYHFGPIFLLNN